MIASFDHPDVGEWFGLHFDDDPGSFWATSVDTGQVLHFDLDSGEVFDILDVGAAAYGVYVVNR